MLATLAVRRRTNDLATWGFAVFVAGGASNWIDRITRGSVVDFLNVGVGPVRTGVFNVADVAIMLGVGAFVLAEFQKDGRSRFWNAHSMKRPNTGWPRRRPRDEPSNPEHL